MILSYPEFRSSFKRVVVLGDPGGGKSTLCQYICYELAKASALQIQFGPDRGIEGQNQRLPLRIILRSFESARLIEPQLSILDFLIKETSNFFSGDIDQIRETILYVLTYGRAVLAFDGLDEILNTAKRREFVTLVSAFIDQFPLCPVLVTSRIVGYQDAPLPDDFEELVLERFDEQEIEKYVAKFLSVVGSLTKSESEGKAKLFMSQTAKNARDLRQNPLLLGLMSFLFSIKGDVPSNRPEIYKECAILMFEKWDQNRNIRAQIPDDFDLLHLFSDVASKIFGNTELEEGVSRNWMRNVVEGYFRRLYESQDKVFGATKSVVDFLTGRSWVMSEFGPEVYRFTHRAFLEYFYARHIDEMYETVPDLFKILRPHIVANEWDVISHLAIQLKTFRNQRRTSLTMIELERLAYGPYRSPKQSKSALMFCAKALEYLPGTEAETKKIVTLIYQAALAGVSKDDMSILGAIGECCHMSLERRFFAREVISSLVFRTVVTGSKAEVAFISAITKRVPVIRVFKGVDEGPVDLPEGMKEKIYKESRADLMRLSERDAIYGGLFWNWYGELREESFTKFGFEVLTTIVRMVPAAIEIHPVSEIVINAFNLVDAVGGSQSKFSQQARDALKVIARHRSNSELPSVKNGHAALRIPPIIWINVLSTAEKDLELLAGVIVCFLISERRQRAAGDHHNSRSQALRRRNGDADASLDRRLHKAGKVISADYPELRSKLDDWLAQRLESAKGGA